MSIIDFRSDTVTKPTPAMRQAMAAAEVGDDGYGEDPTVNRLQEMVAHLLGKEAALKEEGVWVTPTGSSSFRVVTHRDIAAGDLARAANIFKKIFSQSLF